MDRYARTPWIEKYRPRNINDVMLHPFLAAKIQQMIQDKNIPNIILTGTPGIGKTTTLLCIARALYGGRVNDAVLELNASDDRGIKSNDSIDSFCKHKLDIDTNLYCSQKLIIFDEADNITEKAQEQLKSLMDKHGNSTRFAFTSNDSNKIIESIQSKCIILQYTKLLKEHVVTRLKYISEKENITYNDQVYDDIANITDGDIRSAINNLQLVYNAYGDQSQDPDKEIDVYTVCGKPKPEIIKQLFHCCKNNKIEQAVKIGLELKNSGLSCLDIFLQMINVIKTYKLLDLNEEYKIKYLNTICNRTYIVSNGIDTDLQLVACICDMI